MGRLAGQRRPPPGGSPERLTSEGVVLGSRAGVGVQAEVGIGWRRKVPAAVGPAFLGSEGGPREGLIKGVASTLALRMQVEGGL